jgi:hypothetical protein
MWEAAETDEQLLPAAPQPPLAAAALWQTVMDAAGHQCQCAGGLCGSKHSSSGLRCHRTGAHHRLIAAPADLTLSPTVAAAVPAEQLLAWCPDCHRGALSRQRVAARELQRIQAPEPAALFDI